MNENDKNRIQELFLAAVEMPAVQRDAWLIEQCGNNQELLHEVRALLEHDNPNDDPLEKRIDEALQELPSRMNADTIAPREPGAPEMTQVDNELFLSRLSEVGVLSPEEIAALNQACDSENSSSSPRQIASQLVSQGKLTDYQASALLKGQPQLLIDKYLILDLLDAGGMGMVFKAIHRPMNRTVAVKMIAHHLLSSPDQVKRFQREVRVAATLEHPNIVRSYDADQTRGVHFLVMEYVRGENLSNIVQRQGPMSVEQAIDCIRQASQGLRYAQKQGVIHRDIKPGNLMLDRDGQVKVLDLGLANVDESFRLAQQSTNIGDQEGPSAQSLAGSELTTAGAMLGTVSFMAPEQSLDAHKADTRSDIYSLGCTLYYLLVGEAPYHGDTIFQVFMQHREGTIPSLREKRPDVPEKVEKVLQKMLAKSPADRYQSMGELLAGIEDCEVAPPRKKVSRSVSEGPNNGPVNPTVTLASQPSARNNPPKSRSLLGWLTAVVVLLVALGGGYWWWQMNQNDPQRSIAGTPNVGNDMQSESTLGNDTASSNTRNLPLMSDGDQLVDDSGAIYKIPVLLADFERFDEPGTEGPKWKINESEITGTRGRGNIFLPETFRYFDLSLEALVQENGNGGVFFLIPKDRAANRLIPGGYELQIAPAGDVWGNTGTVGLDNNHLWKETERFNEPNRWYDVHIRFDRHGLKVAVDGTIVYQTEHPEYESGKIGFQCSPRKGAVHYRNIRVIKLTDVADQTSTSSLVPEANMSAADLLATGEYEWSAAEKLPAPINSHVDEHSAHMTADGLTIVFSSMRNGGYGKPDLWMSTRETTDSDWSEPTNLGENINSKNHERDAIASEDLKTIIFSRMHEDGVQSLVSRRMSLEAEWSTPEPFNIKGHSKYWSHITSDGLTIVFPQGMGEGNHDLFIGRRSTQEEPWTDVASMGTLINTDRSERYCTISDDGRLLIFERKNVSGSEWWMATRSGWTEPWTLPVRLECFDAEGKPANFRLSPDGKSLLFAMAADATGNNLDLYTSKLVQKPKLGIKASASGETPSETPPKSAPAEKN